MAHSGDEDFGVFDRADDSADNDGPPGDSTSHEASSERASAPEDYPSADYGADDYGVTPTYSQAEDPSTSEDFGVIDDTPAPVSNTPKTPDDSGDSADVPASGGCLILGPSQAGKTMLLLAIARACYRPLRDQPDMTFQGESSANVLMKKAVDILMKRPDPGRGGKSAMLATEAKEERTFAVRVWVKRPWWLRWRPPKLYDRRFVVTDGPGGYLFPEEAREGTNHDPHDMVAFEQEYQRWIPELVKAGREADALILCVDASRPRSDLWEAHLGDLLHRMAGRTSNEPPFGKWTLKLGAWLDRWTPALLKERLGWKWNPPKTASRFLGAKRVLLLLTKVDLLAYEVLEGFRRPTEDLELLPTAELVKGLRPRKMADMIDPIEQVRNTLGVSVLNTIRSRLAPGTEFGIGLTSAGGFDSASGEGFLDSGGQPLSARTDGEDILRHWHPFGIYDALYFILTGKAQGMVRTISRRDMLADDDTVNLLIAASDAEMAH